MLWWGEPRISDSNSIVCFITQEMHEFSNEYAKKGKIQQNASYEESRKIGTHIFSKVWVLPWYPMVQFIPREMHGYSYENLIAREHAAKPILWGELAKLIAILFPKYGWFSPIRFQSYGILYHMEIAWVLPSMSHCMRKYRKTLLSSPSVQSISHSMVHYIK